MSQLFIFFCGPPFVGKSTQTQKVLSAFPHFRLLSTTNIVNDKRNANVLSETVDNGQQLTIREILDRGWYVDAPTILKLVKKEIENFGGAPIISDSYPRSVAQLKDMEEKIGLKLSAIFYLSASSQKAYDDIFKRRKEDRRVCPKCRNNFDPITNLPTDGGFCPQDGQKLEMRFDDMGELARKRYESYLKNAAPMVEVLKEKENFFEISVDNSNGRELLPAEVFEKISEKLSGILKTSEIPEHARTAALRNFINVNP